VRAAEPPRSWSPPERVQFGKRYEKQLDGTEAGRPLEVWLEVSSAARPPAGVKVELPDRTETITAWQGKAPAWWTTKFRAPVPAGDGAAVAVTVPNPGPGGAAMDRRSGGSPT
jgi:hypothetical protein